ncbi:MAG: hypothetical protein QOF48_375, partial [Verrucomicrobiota bacterium]
TPWGVERLDQAGLWRLRPRQLRLDPFLGSEMAPHNPWGFVFDDWNRMFVLAGNGHGIFDPLPVLIRGHRITPLDQIWKDSRGRKVCGGDIVGNSHFPPDWQGLMLCGGFMNNAVYALRIAEDGASFSVSDRAPLLTSTHGSFRPVDVKIGADGAVYVTDWYNPIIGHYQASFRDPTRDKQHGRIWRITAKDRPLSKPPRLEGEPVIDLLAHLKSNDRFTRWQAKRLLADMETGMVTNALTRWLEHLDRSDPAIEHHWMEALGVYESHEAVASGLLLRLLQAKDARARAYAASVVGRWADRLDDPLSLLKPLIKDDQPRVRLSAIVAATGIPRSETAAEVLAAIDKPVDKFIDYALRQAVFVLKPHWLPAFGEGRLGIEHRPAQLEFLVKADASADTLRVLRRLLARGDLAEDTREAFFNTLAEAGDTNDLGMLLDPAPFTRDGVYDVALQARVLAGLEKSARIRNLKPSAGRESALEKLWSASTDARFQIALLKLAMLWKVPAMKQPASMAMQSTEADWDLRNTSAETFAGLSGAGARGLLEEMAGPTRLPGRRVAAAVGMAMIDLPRACEIAADILSQDTNGLTPSHLLPTFFSRRDGPVPLAAALSKTVPARDAARMGLRWMSAVGREDKEVVRVLNAAAGLSSEPLKATPGFVGPLAVEVRARGDAQRGREVFRRADLNCLSCHSLGGEGGTIGPDLNAIGAGQPLDFIIGAVLEPNREVKENYEAIEITMKDGAVHTGYRVRDTPMELALRDVALNDVVRLRRDQIQSEIQRGSVMPAGLVDHLTRAELRDLFRFLSELGKSR